MKFLKTLSRHAPKLLTIAACAGTVTTGVFAFKAGVNSSDIIKQTKEDLANCNSSEERRKILIDGGKQVALKLIPTGISTALTIACGAGALSASGIQLKNMTKIAEAGMARAGSLYNVLKEEYGEPKANKLMAKASSKKLELEPTAERYIVDAGGDIRCCVEFFNADFISTQQDVDLALRHLACQCDQENGVTGTDLLHLLGYFENVGAADCICWHPAHLTKDINGYPKLPIETTTIMRDGQPCLNIYFLDYSLRRY